MSHQTGIKAGDELKEVFRRCKTADDIRLVKIAIEEETLTCAGMVNIKSSDWRDDYDSAVKPLLEEKHPCYMLFRIGTKGEWLFIAYTPDSAKVREKMLYAGTRATAKQEFGGGFILDELIGTDIEDVTLSGYDEHKRAASVPAPLTDREEELKMVKAEENSSEINVSSRHQTVQGLLFPFTDDLVDCLHQFKDGVLNYLQLDIDTAKELILLTTSGNHGINELERVIPLDEAHYHIYRYSHVFEGESIESLVFIYAMPGYKCPIKARMLFSSCKGPVLDALEQNFGITFNKKLEVQGEAITEKFINSEIHPPVLEVKEKFSKPKAPGRRGPARRPNRPVE